MSLQLAAQHLASRGRGPDTTLVHMAPQEVAGLQALAKAHGGSLTINPDTGLAEAGFLSSILPMVAGAALSFVPGVGPMMAAGLVGGGTALATGSLQKGLMAGLGAYGGAGLAGSLAGAGSAAGLGAAGAEAAAAGTAAETAALAEANAAQSAIANTTASTNAAAAATPEFAAFNATPNQFGAFGEAAGSYVPPTQAANIVPTVTAAPIAGAGNVSVEQMLRAGFTPEQIAESAQEFAANTAGNAATPFSSGTQAALDSPLKAGFNKFMDKPSDFFTKENMKYGLAALTPVGMEMMAPKKSAVPEPTKFAAQNFSFDPGRVADPYAGRSGAYTGEVMHFNPVYTRTAAGGGLMDISPIEAMSNQNQAETMMANGGMRFAEGGETKAVRPVEQDPYYTMTGQSGDAFKYLMGQGAKPVVPAAATVAAPVQQAQAQVAQNLGPQNAVLGKVIGGLNPLGQSMFRGMFADNPAIQQAISGGQGGSWQEDTTGRRDYTFDPNTGTFTAAAPQRTWVPTTTTMSAPDPFGKTMTSADRANLDGVGGYGMAQGGIASLAQGGQSHLGDYSDGGRLLRGPGDGVSDDIPATIGDKRPARLADGEFVVPARIVSELGNGSTEAGARKLYAMMDRVQKARGKTVGKDRVAVNSRADKLLPA